MAKIFEQFGLTKRTALDAATVALFGVECEIESVNCDNTEWSKIQGIDIHDDASLRNRGKELVWNTPRSRDASMAVFNNLHKRLCFYDEAEKFSERTSTHVHMNVRSLEHDQLLTLLQLYILFEELFFLQAEPYRRENIYCMPLTETHLPSVYYYQNVTDYFSKWSKYTALNLKRLEDLGTVEFRHLQGTDDAKVMSDWLLSLESLYNLCQKTKVTKDLLKNEVQIQEYADTLFGHHDRYKLVRPNLMDLLENSIIDLKLSFA